MDADSPDTYDIRLSTARDQGTLKRVKTRIPSNALFTVDRASGDLCMYVIFTTRDDAVKFALDRNDDYCTLCECGLACNAGLSNGSLNDEMEYIVE